MNNKRILTLLSATLLTALSVSAQNLVLGWDFDDTYGAGNTANGVVGGTANTAVESAYNVPQISVSSFNIGAGVLSANPNNENTLGGYRTRGWGSATVADAILANEYMTFTVTALGVADLDHIDIMSASLAGPFTLTLRSSLDGFTSDLGSFLDPIEGQTPSVQTYTLGTEFDAVNTVEFRIYLTATTPNNFNHHVIGLLTGDDDVYDIAVYGTVPEPSTYAAIAGLAALFLVFYRRRR